MLLGTLLNARAAEVILNEYNAVSNTELLKDGKSDVFWGSRVGNGKDWFELVVTEDHLDMRGWKFEVRDNVVDRTSGESWLIALTDHDIWSDLRSGTIITISEELKNNADQYNPLIGRWWLNVRAAAGTAGTFATVECILPVCAPQEVNWKVTNSSWQVIIRDALGASVFGPAGEGISPEAGVGSREVFKLEANPRASIQPNSDRYNDGTSSTFGQPNVYAGGRRLQNFHDLRSVAPFSQLTTVRINEVFSHSDPGEDWVELYNTTDSAVNIGGWFLSDDFENLRKYEIAAGRKIPARSFVLFKASALGFVFSSSCGEAAVLSVAGGGKLTGERDFAEFGAVENGVSFGRFPDGSGSLVRLTTATQKSANAAPLIGPVVINEIMYNPPDPGSSGRSDPEFIELHNMSIDAVDLSASFGPDGVRPWKLAGGVAFEFPLDTTIQAGGFLVVVNFDPELKPGRLAEFRGSFGLDRSVPIVGPYGGGLNNFSDTVLLQKPDTPESSVGGCGDVLADTGRRLPQVTIDEVTYFDFGEWPEAADGGGPSLERINPRAFGDDASNWKANRDGVATPGARNSVTDDTTDDNPCTIETCVGRDCESTAVPDGTSCSDGDACNGGEICQIGLCISGTPLVCGDGNSCTSDDECVGGQCDGAITVVQRLSCALENLATQDICPDLPKKSGLRRVLRKQLRKARSAVTKAEQKLTRKPSAKVKRHVTKIRKALRKIEKTVKKKVQRSAKAKKGKKKISPECAATIQGLTQLSLELLADVQP